MSLFTSAPLQNKNAVFGERKIMHLSTETIFLSSLTCNAAAYKVCNNTKSNCNKNYTPYLQQRANKFFFRELKNKHGIMQASLPFHQSNAATTHDSDNMQLAIRICPAPRVN